MAELKTQNEGKLSVLLLMALVPFYLAIVVLHKEILWSFANSHPWQAFAALATIGLGPVVCLRAILHLIVNNVGARWKERLAHLRWSNPLPGTRADKLVHDDARIDIRSLPPEVTALLDETMSPKDRNAHWYNHIFRPVRNIDAVSNTHRRYLLYREASAGAFVTFWAIAIADGASHAIYDFSLMTLPAYVATATYVMLLIGAANQAGNRMVTGAIANFSSTKFQGGAQ